MSIMLIMLLDGLWTGITRSVTAYETHAGADLYVAQPGTRNFFGATSQLPVETLDTVRAQPGVEWAAAVRTYLSIVDFHGKKIPTAVIGWQPGQHGGPWVIGQGREPLADDEIAIGPVLAEQHGLRVGDDLELLGRRFRIVGTSSDTFMISFAFMTHDAANSLLGLTGSTSFVLIGTDQPEQVRAQLAGGGLTVIDGGALAHADVSSATRAYQVPMDVMRTVAFGIGSIVVALSVYTAIMERRHEYGIVKAMGAGRRHIVAWALAQTAIVTVMGLAAGGVLFAVGRLLIVWARPQFQIVATLSGLLRVVIAATLMAAAAALIPAHQLSRLEPAAAYQS